MRLWVFVSVVGFFTCVYGEGIQETILVVPRQDGFNNQLLTIYPDIRCAVEKGTRLVVPHMFEHVVAGDRKVAWPDGPFPFSDYFDMDHLRKYADVISPDEYFEKCHRVLVHCPFNKLRFRSRRMHYWQRNNELNPTNSLLRYYTNTFNVSFVCANSKDSQPINITPLDGDCLANFTDACSGFGNEWDALYPSEKIVDALRVLRSNLPDDFNCMHYRGADFNGSPQKMVSNKLIEDGLARLAYPSLPMYVMTPTVEIDNVASILQANGFGDRISFFRDYEKNMVGDVEWVLARNDVRMFLSQLLCARSRQFLGTQHSTVTGEVVLWRNYYDMHPRDTFYFGS